jgi:hypothetical protein
VDTELTFRTECAATDCEMLIQQSWQVVSGDEKPILVHNAPISTLKLSE